MADYKELKPFILKWEGGYSNRKSDRGGETNMGVTMATFRSVYGQDKTSADLKAITDEEWNHIFLTLYWNPCLATEINSQSVANMMVDFAWNCGTVRAIKYTQNAVGVVADGICGPQTLRAINKANPKTLFDKLKRMRLAYYDAIVAKDSSQKANLQGWRNRVNNLKY